MIIDVLSIFPSFFSGPLNESLLGKAISQGLIRVRVHDIRKYARDKHRTVDDRPYGGGAGMVMKPEPIVEAIEDLQKESPRGTVILLSPQGEVFTQATARELSGLPRIILVCGRYEGIDARVLNFVDRELSIGDYVLSGGEPAALVVIDAVSRLIPGVVGNLASVRSESFEEGLLEYPQYTRPRIFRGLPVPDVLISGNHEAVKRWRRSQALLLTKLRRPDLFERLKLSDEDLELLREAERAMERESSGEY
ncbi:tRNA (Guanine37-N(1)-) methyltransferase [Thermodesulforhabdus norvegica]|uniref:tRNA (guanine-N(1)-)-methyltransferase n=2 Tax=Thermodesulforhabdus norvegica TaxID=39841 RepID=A0A1I4QYZ0_9BACT|nr:tRNA (guanosine(37)-N1)-methyltransferase TrmD [Thermodesulforhabdus norvegica]SFM45201.1 tRNA (Guanine37-N(1)-) methyltransferase [Thermodesulforhabdus norvegica]